LRAPRSDRKHQERLERFVACPRSNDENDEENSA
jgi:hypothetical protein